MCRKIVFFINEWQFNINFFVCNNFKFSLFNELFDFMYFIFSAERNCLVRKKIIFKNISMMTFHSYELIEKYILVFSQCKEIEKFFEDDETSKSCNYSSDVF